MEQVLTEAQVNEALRRKRIRAKVGKIVVMVLIYLVLLMMYAPFGRSSSEPDLERIFLPRRL